MSCLGSTARWCGLWVLGFAAVLNWGSPATAAPFTFTTFNLTPFSSPTNVWQSFDLSTLAGGLPASGTYGSFTMTVNWSGPDGSDPSYSNEAVVFFSSTPGSGTGSTPTFGPGNVSHSSGQEFPTSGGASNNAPAILTWSNVLFSTQYTGGNPLFLNYRQDWPGSGQTVQWDSVTITLNEPPPPPASTFVAAPTTITGTLAAGQVDWYSFDYDGTSPLELFAGGNPTDTDFDAALALYDSVGQLVARNTEIDLSGNFNAQIVANGGVPAGPDTTVVTGLAAGTYYLAVTPYNPTTGSGFNVVGGTFPSGTGPYQVSFSGIGVAPVPEPSTYALLAGAMAVGAGWVRRRRAKA